MDAITVTGAQLLHQLPQPLQVPLRFLGAAAGLLGVVLLLGAALSIYSLVLLPWLERRYYAAQGLKGPAFRPLVGDLPDIVRFRNEGKPFYELFRERKAKYGPVTFNFLGPLFRIISGDPAFAREVLVTQADAFTKPAFMRRVLGPLLGNGLVLSDGEVWKRHRALIGPTFHYHRLTGMVPLMAEAAVDAMDRWEARILAHNSQRREVAGTSPAAMEMDVHVELSSITLSIILEAAFALRMRNDDRGVYKAIKVLLLVSEIVGRSAWCGAQFRCVAYAPLDLEGWGVVLRSCLADDGRIPLLQLRVGAGARPIRSRWMLPCLA